MSLMLPHGMLDAAAARFLQPFLAGYFSAYAVDAGFLETLPLFLGLRQMILYLMLAPLTDAAGVQPSPFFQQSLTEAENRTPFLRWDPAAFLP
jgi:hypothetical protein